MNRQLTEQLWERGYTVTRCMTRDNGLTKVEGYKIFKGEKQVNSGEYVTEYEAQKIANGGSCVV